MGQVLQAGAGQIPARQAAVDGRHPDDRPGADDQQGLPVRPRRDRAGRPADPRRRVRHRRGRRPGVDDQRAAPAAEVPRGLQVRRRRRMLDSMAYDGLSDAFDQQAMGEATETRTTPATGLTREEQDDVRRPLAPAGRARREERPVRRGDRPGADPAAQGRPDRVPRRRGHPGRHHRRVARHGCARRSPRTAPSPPAPRRRSPTVLRRSS